YAVSYLHDGWLHATDYQRHLTLQLVRPGPHHRLGLFSDGISSYGWSPNGDAVLYRFSSISENTRQTYLILHYRNGVERLLADTDVDGDYHWLPGSTEVVRVRRNSVAIMDMATGDTRCLPLPDVTLGGDVLLTAAPNTIELPVVAANATSTQLARLDLSTGSLSVQGALPCEAGRRLSEWQRSPDGEQVAVVCYVGHALNTVSDDDLTALEPVRINRTGGGVRDVGWSPDGGRLLYAALSNRGRPAPVVIDMSTGETTALDLGRDAQQVRWMPTRHGSSALPHPSTLNRLVTDWNNTWPDC
ncbi:MAG: hypothetical protein AAF125_24215, partial [Chloroflexota bacterium]